MKPLPRILRSLHLKGWRSFAPDNTAGLDRLEQVNIIAGANNVGKSNYIRFLVWLRKESHDNFPEPKPHDVDRWMKTADLIDATISFDVDAIRMDNSEKLSVDADLSTFGQSIVDDKGTIRIRLRTIKHGNSWRFLDEVLLRPGIRPDTSALSDRTHDSYWPFSFGPTPTETDRHAKHAYDAASNTYTVSRRDHDVTRFLFSRNVIEAFLFVLGDAMVDLDAIRRDEAQSAPSVASQSPTRRASRIGSYPRVLSIKDQSSNGTGLLASFSDLFTSAEAGYDQIRISLESALHRWLAEPISVFTRTDGNKTHFLMRNTHNLEIGLSSFGSGVSELVLQYLHLLIYKHRRLARRGFPILLLIDDPECHLHPALVLDYVRLVAKETPECQFIMTSHSSVLMDGAREGWRLFHADRDERGRTRTVSVADTVNQRALIAALGVSPGQMALSTVVIWVEGPSDILYIRRLMADSCPNSGLLEYRDYSFAMYGGALIKHVGFESHDSKVLVGLLSICSRPIVVCDRDRGFDASGTRCDANLKEPVLALREAAQPDAVHVTPGREIENLVLPKVLFSMAKRALPRSKPKRVAPALSSHKSFVTSAATHFDVDTKTIRSIKYKLAGSVVGFHGPVFRDDALTWGRLLVDAIAKRQ